MTSGRSKLVDVEGELLEIRDKSYMVDFGLDDATFLPKSLTECDGSEGEMCEFTIPQWLAEEKDLI